MRERRRTLRKRLTTKRKVKTFRRRRQRYALKGGLNAINKFAKYLNSEYEKIITKIIVINYSKKPDCSAAKHIVDELKVIIPTLQNEMLTKFHELQKFKLFFYFDFKIEDLPNEETQKLIEPYLPIVNAFKKFLGIYNQVIYEELIHACSSTFPDHINHIISTYVQLNLLLRNMNLALKQNENCHDTKEKFIELTNKFNTYIYENFPDVHNISSNHKMSTNDEHLFMVYKEKIDELTSTDIDELNNLCPEL